MQDAKLTVSKPPVWFSIVSRPFAAVNGFFLLTLVICARRGVFSGGFKGAMGQMHVYEPIEDNEAGKFAFLDKSKLIWASLDQNARRIKGIGAMQLLLALLLMVTASW